MSAALESLRFLGLRWPLSAVLNAVQSWLKKVACSGVWSVSVFWLTVAFIGIWLGWLAFGAWPVPSLACAGWLHRCRLCGLRWPWTAVESLETNGRSRMRLSAGLAQVAFSGNGLSRLTSMTQTMRWLKMAALDLMDSWLSGLL